MSGEPVAYVVMSSGYVLHLTLRGTNGSNSLQNMFTSNVFLRHIAIAPSLTAFYDGPYKVASGSGGVQIL